MPKTTSDGKILTLEKELKFCQKQIERLQRRCGQEIERLQKRCEREIKKISKSADELGLLEVRTDTIKSSVLQRLEAKRARRRILQAKTSNHTQKVVEEPLQEVTTLTAEKSETPITESLEM